MTRPSLRSESLTLEFDPACGGRITSLRHGARELERIARRLGLDLPEGLATL